MSEQQQRRMCSLAFTLLLLPSTISSFTILMPRNPSFSPLSTIQSFLPFQFQLNAVAESESHSLPMSSSDNNNRKKKITSFEERMRVLALGKPRSSARVIKPVTHKQRTNTSGKLNIRPTNLQIVENLEEYKQVVGEEAQKIVVVRFFATWCKSCRAIAPKYYRLANQYPQIKFVDVPVTTNNADLHQGLGVPSVPFGHIYHPQAGLVEELKMSRKYFNAFSEKLSMYDDECCVLSDDVKSCQDYTI